MCALLFHRLSFPESINTFLSNIASPYSIRLKVSKVEFITVNSITHKTSGQIANHASLVLTYSGTLASNKWLSLVDSTLESNDPCSRGLQSATSPADSMHSSPLRAPSSGYLVTINIVHQYQYSLSSSCTHLFPPQVTLDSTPLDTTKSFAVCYAEVSGSHTDAWSDSGVRFTVSKVSSVVYGEETGRTPRISISGLPVGNDMFPQVIYDAIFAFTMPQHVS